MTAYDWIPLQEKYYRRNEIYKLEWKIDRLEDFHVLFATEGGPIALRRNPKRLVELKAQTLKNQIVFYSSSGTYLSSFEWHNEEIVHWWWSKDWSLKIFSKDGTLFSYSIYGEYEQFSVTNVNIELN